MDCASPLIESLVTDALTTWARAMRGLHSDSLSPISEGCAASLRISLIGIERWQFVEGRLNESATIFKAAVLLIQNGFCRADGEPAHGRERFASADGRARHEIGAGVTRIRVAGWSSRDTPDDARDRRPGFARARSGQRHAGRCDRAGDPDFARAQSGLPW